MFSKGFWFGVISVVALTLGFSDTALAQLTATPSSFTFNVSSGSSQTTQIQITSTVGTTITAGNLPSWLGVSPAGPINMGPGTPVTYTVTASAVGFSNGQQLTGSFTVGGAGLSPLSVPVTMNVGGSTSGTLSASPANLTFSATVGGAFPASQTVTINNSAGTPALFNAAATSTNNWLQISSSQGTTGSASATLTVSVNQNSSGLTAGAYDASINISSTSGSFSIPVHLTVTGAPTLSVSPTGPMNFFYQFGGSTNPASQTLTLTASAGSVPFTVSTAASSPGTWLVVSPLGSSATGANGTSIITVSISTVNLQPGNYTGQITITSQSAATIQIPVNLQVSTNPLLIVGNSSLTFSGAAGTTTAFTQQVGIASSGNALTFTASANSGGAPTTWLSVIPSGGITGTQTGTLTVRADPTNLPAGTYNGTITISSINAANSPTIQVTLTLTNSVVIAAAPPALIFNFQTNQGNPLAQTISLTSNGAAQQFTVAATTSNCGSWLQAVAQSSQTPGTIIVSVSTQQGGFTPGTPCQGTVTVTPTGQGQNPLPIPVTLNISNSALLNVSPTYVSLSVQAGQNPTTIPTISIVSTDPINPINFGTTVNPGASWLFVGPGSFTPANLSYQVSSAFLSPGTYSGTITIAPTVGGALPVTVTISLTVLSASGIAASPANLTFGQAQGAAAPASQTIRLTSTGGGGVLNYSFSATTQNGTSWLSVASPSGQLTGATPGDIVVSVNSGTLVQGSYDGTITVVAPGANNTPLQIPVRLNVTQAQTLTISASTMSFNFQVGNTAPPADQTLTITSTGGTATFTVTKAVQQPTGGTWLSVNPTSGTTANNNGQFTAGVTVSVNPAGLVAGTYIGTVTVASPILAQPITSTVTLTVAGLPLPTITQVLNAGSNQPGPISPGEILTIKGTALGPAVPVNYSLNSQGGLDPRLAGVRVLFDSFAGSPYYVSATQINVIVPYEIAGRIVTTITVEYQNQVSPGQTYQVSPTSPGIFTLNSTGSGPGAIINQDGTYNGPGQAAFPASYPTFGAPRGSVVAVYATGGGQTDPPSATGCFIFSGLRLNAIKPVTVAIAGIQAEVTFAGAAPGGPCGFMQINVKIPDTAPIGQSFITFSVNGIQSPATPTITVR